MAWQSASVVLAKGVHPVKNVHFDETQAHPFVAGQSVWLNESQYAAYVSTVGGVVYEVAHFLFVASHAQFKLLILVQSPSESNWAHVQSVVEYVYAVTKTIKIDMSINYFISIIN